MHAIARELLAREELFGDDLDELGQEVRQRPLPLHGAKR